MSSMRNYTTQIDYKKSVTEIEDILIENGATNIWKEYSAGIATSVNFTIPTEHGIIPVSLKANVDGVKQVMMKEQAAGKLTGISRVKAMDENHARNVAWRILRDWVDAQISRTKAEGIPMTRVFFAEILDMAKKKTLYELAAEGQLKQLTAGDFR